MKEKSILLDKMELIEFVTSRSSLKGWGNEALQQEMIKERFLEPCLRKEEKKIPIIKILWQISAYLTFKAKL